MSERSPELKKFLIESLGSEQISKKYHAESEQPYISDERREQLRQNFEEEHSRIVELEAKVQKLFEQYTDISDSDFDREYQEASKELQEIIARIKRYSAEHTGDRLYTVEFSDLEKIKSLDDFLDAFPMQFIPRKEEIGRMLALAKQMHEARIQEGKKDDSEPIKIVDIGGANGALGKYVADLAEENNLEIEYIVVDPDSRTVRGASQFYTDQFNLRFKEQAGEEFNLEQYKEDSEAVNLLKKRKEIIEEGERKRMDLEKLVSEIRDKGHELSPDAIEIYLKILRDNFGIEGLTSFPNQREKFLAQFEDQRAPTGYEMRSFVDIYMDDWRDRVASLTNELEGYISQQPARYDLVINSWMPVQTDLTKEIREANGAAILYILERYGATGCRSDAPYPEKPLQVGHDESYHPGSTYESKLGWISHSTPQVKTMIEGGVSDFRKSRTRSDSPFANGFIVQVKNDYRGKLSDISPANFDIQVEDNYPWEEELNEKGGEISPVIELEDEEGELDYFSSFDDLEVDIAHI